MLEDLTSPHSDSAYLWQDQTFQTSSKFQTQTERKKDHQFAESQIRTTSRRSGASSSDLHSTGTLEERINSGQSTRVKPIHNS
ncbi:hypothetical protein PGT21_031764 [Puccinia graminis f. sp. tritici]|uniref:Uncharacterized protein n=1 Tax=Puccinia graminis f. sp. tritici TaxID=56615 RepID=A0A5B0NRV8_PUCGR|nr:hypothetical protein PGT21_031764 [Puccinia graminis f. sp. tritici]